MDGTMSVVDYGPQVLRVRKKVELDRPTNLDL